MSAPAVRLLLALAALPCAAPAAPLTVAAASNFAAPAAELAAAFAASGGPPVRVVTGSSGKLYAQILAGAPFDVLLSADQEKPAALAASGAGLADTRFTYAVGRLALYSSAPDAAVEGGRALRGGGRLALANPRLAPYGRAAMETLEALGLGDFPARRMATSENVAQAWQFAASGNAPLGFVALSQTLARPGGAVWLVPESLHAPIRQDAIALARGAPAARDFLAFLRSPAARRIIKAAGYRAAD